jgi:hypothetical protein
VGGVFGGKVVGVSVYLKFVFNVLDMELCMSICVSSSCLVFLHF